MASTAPFTGRCFCGAISYQISQKEPDRSYVCHCIDCRQSSGSSFAHNAVFEGDSLTISDSNGCLSTFGNAEEGSKRFCGRCGSPLFLTTPSSHAEMGSKVIVCVGTIDGSEKSEVLRPRAEGWCKRRERWLEKLTDAEGFDEW